MSDLPVERLLNLLEHPDPYLPDGRIESTDIDSWQRILTLLNGSDHRITIDNQPTKKLAVEDLDLPGGSRTLKIYIHNGAIQINVYPLVAESIDFDFDTREIVDQPAADALASFIRQMAKAAGQPASLSVQGSAEPGPIRYDPSTDAFALTDSP